MIGELASEAFDKAMVMFWLFLGFMGVMFGAVSISIGKNEKTGSVRITFQI